MNLKIVAFTTIAVIIINLGIGIWYSFYKQSNNSIEIRSINAKVKYYNVLSINWPFTVCVNATKSCIRPLPNRWTIHGLWPNGLDNSMISDCTSEKYDSNQIRMLKTRMDEQWLSVKKSGNDAFWKHEWQKHGTCATGYSQYDYFNKTLSLFERYDVNRMLKNNGINYGSLINVADIRRALEASGLRSDMFVIQCKNSYKQPYLFEIRMCFTADLKPMTCAIKSNCKKPQVFYVMK